MHRHLVRVTARPTPLQRPAKVIVLEARREARLQQAPSKPFPPRAA